MSDAPIRLRSDVHFREVGGEILALDLSGGSYLSVNGSGTVLWPLLVRGTTTRELGDHLVATYGVDAERAAADVEAWLAKLREQELLVA